ncbi:MAG: class I SAM-dependent methyltransferase [Actinomycetota bacterium]
MAAGPGGWRGYDRVARDYARMAARCHLPIARDLVTLVAVPSGARVLDLGAGTGVVASVAADTAGASGSVVALDPSAALLAQVHHRGVDIVAGSTPGLPFADASFDVVTASLVLGHLDDPRLGLADAARVLRPGGRLGLASWGRLDDPPPVDGSGERAAHAVWDTVVARHTDLDRVDEAAAAALPGEAWFADPARIRLALAEAGLRSVACTAHTYRVPLTHEDWRQRVGTGARARFVRSLLDEEESAAVDAEVLAALRERVPEPIQCVDEVIVTVATAPT